VSKAQKREKQQAYSYTDFYSNIRHHITSSLGGQTITFLLGMLCFVIALQSPLEPLSEHFLFFHQIEHLLMRGLGPLLLILSINPCRPDRLPGSNSSVSKAQKREKQQAYSYTDFYSNIRHHITSSLGGQKLLLT
jgi:hypothetical protein